MEPFDHYHYHDYSSQQRRARRRPPSGPFRILEIMSGQKVFIGYIIVMLIACGGVLFWGYLRVNSCSLISNETVSINGSTAFAPLVKDVARDYAQKCSGANVSVNARPLSQQGSLNGLQQLENSSSIDIGTSDVFANPYQYPGLKDYQIAAVVFALVVNSDVHVKNLTTNQIQRIYSGDITNWSDVDGEPNQQIVLVSRPLTSGTRLTFDKYILGGIETISGPQSLLTDTSETVATNVRDQQGAIGYLSLYYAKKYRLKVLSIDGHSPFDSTLVKKDLYRFWSIEHMYTKVAPSGPTKDFIDHMFSSDAQRIISQDAALNPADFSQSVLIKHIAQE